MKILAPSLLLTISGAAILVAQTQPAAGPALTIDVSQNRHSISPDIYGINQYSDPGLGPALHIPVRRWGGDATSRYNWKNDTWNSAADWYFENFGQPSLDVSKLPAGSVFDQTVDQDHQSGTRTMGTIPMMGWLPKSRGELCGFSVAKYGAQQKTDPYNNADCGNGILLDGTQITGNDPHDTSMPVDESFSQDWLRHLISRYGPANQGGVRIWSLDNEPVWWSGVHIDIHPQNSTYDEVAGLGIQYAAAVKAVDPAALVSGPVCAGWMDYFYSRADLQSGWDTPPYQYWDNPTDQNAHGGVPFVEWYLQQMRNYEQQHGTRLLDYVDVHAYIAPANIAFATDPGDAATQALRLTSTRVFWDANYLFQDQTINAPPQLIPRMHGWVDNNYPGTKLAITEYNWGALNDITGALAQADILGIFGREGLDLGTLWGPPQLTDPGAFAFKIYRNYDDMGGAFGETGVLAQATDPDKLSVFAAQRSDSALTVIVINKTTGSLTSQVSLANFTPDKAAKVFRYSGAHLSGIAAQPDQAVASNGFSATFPAYSITLFVIPQSPASLPVPKPDVAAVVNAASYGKDVAPGQIVTIFGSNLGPSTLQGLALDSNGLVAASLAGAQVLFDGAPAPLVYVSANQLSAIVPYTAAVAPSTHVQVQYQGVRSDALEVPVVEAAPGIFTNDASGTGQGAILNQDGSRNSAANPAARGSVISIYMTGEGQTDPPGFDGKVAG
ncbi:MAG TPA: glycoside hydrolase family 44 protein, partial [Bryobacteraceae bacterium]|nr:glycoside hydrolase family 44 protein [Bryobacteraceae bacterium]